MTKLSSTPYYLFLFNHLDSDVLPFTFRAKDEKRCSQPHSREYDWLCPDLTQNTGGCYILISAEVLINPVTARPIVYVFIPCCNGLKRPWQKFKGKCTITLESTRQRERYSNCEDLSYIVGRSCTHYASPYVSTYVSLPKMLDIHVYIQIMIHTIHCN